MRLSHSRFSSLSFIFCVFLATTREAVNVHSFQISLTSHPRRTPTTISGTLRGEASNNIVLYAENSSGKAKTKGVYVRPSAAIERGSGFYVPGLEGSRVRIIFGTLCLILSYVNSALGLADSNADAVAFSSKLVLFYGLLLLFQGLVEFAKEAGLGLDFDVKESVESSKANNAKSLEQIVASGMDEKSLEKIKWVAATFVSLTPAVQVMLLESNGDGDDEVLYSLGSSEFQKNDDLNQSISAAVDTVFESKGGRVSVPDTHPCATLLPEESRRCILLQRVMEDGSDNNQQRRCLIVGSNQLLAAFTKNDLKWLGSLAKSLA